MKKTLFLPKYLKKGSRLHTRDTTTSETFCAEPLWRPSKTEHPTENKGGGKNVQGVGISHVTTQKICLNLQLQQQEKKLPSDKISPVLIKMSSTAFSEQIATCNMWVKLHQNSRTEQQPTDSVLTTRKAAPSVTNLISLVIT